MAALHTYYMYMRKTREYIGRSKIKYKPVGLHIVYSVGDTFHFLWVTKICVCVCVCVCVFFLQYSHKSFFFSF